MNTQDKINLILKKIHFTPCSHNEIYTKHLKAFLTILIEDESQEWKQIKYKASLSLGVGYRYVKDYFRGIVAWGVCDLDEQDKIIWKIKFEDETK